MSDLDREIMRALPDAATHDDYISTPDIHRWLSRTALDTPTVRTINRRLAKLERDGLVEVLERGTALVSTALLMLTPINPLLLIAGGAGCFVGLHLLALI